MRADKQIPLWADNKTSGLHYRSLDEIKAGYDKWIATKGEHYVNHYPRERLIRLFITDPTPPGLNSVFDESDWHHIYQALTNSNAK